MARLGDPVALGESGIGTDVGIESAGRSNDRVGRDGTGECGILLSKSGGGIGQSFFERGISWREVRSLRRHAVVSLVTRGGWPWMEIFGPREVLADEAGSDHLTARCNQAPVRLVMEQKLREPGDCEGIDESGNDGEY